MFVCISDRYSPTRDTYESIEEFNAMCLTVHGRYPELRERSRAVWSDDEGAVLVDLEEGVEVYLVNDSNVGYVGYSKWVKQDEIETRIPDGWFVHVDAWQHQTETRPGWFVVLLSRDAPDVGDEDDYCDEDPSDDYGY